MVLLKLSGHPEIQSRNCDPKESNPKIRGPKKLRPQPLRTVLKKDLLQYMYFTPAVKVYD